MNVRKELMKCVNLLKKGYADKALIKSEKIISQNPGLALGYLLKGRALIDLNKSEMAVDILEKSLSIDPGSASAYIAMASALADSGKIKDACQYCLKAFELAPNSPDIQVSVGLRSRRYSR